MARDYSGTANYSKNTSAASTTSATMTMAGWVYMDTALAGMVPFGMYGATSAAHQRYVEIQADGDVGCLSNVSSNWATATVAGFTASTWHHVGGVWDGIASRTAYLNGTGGVAETTSRNVTNTCTAIGCYLDAVASSGSALWNGFIAEVGIWSAALTAAEMAMLAKGVRPLMVRPESLVSYWPTYGRVANEPDIVGGINMTLSGADANAAHPRIMYPHRRARGRFNRTSGTWVVGGTLTQGQGLIAGSSPIALTYQWQRDGGTGTWVNIPGATSATYVIQSADIGSDVRVTHTATNNASADSEPSSETGAVTAS